tara:strand:- start:52 stop:5166 length:5115 start_codon:yes stop_codon:yes gene_type:complete
MHQSHFFKLRLRAFSSFLFGVLLIFLLASSVSAFQADSLAIDTTLTGVQLGATAWGDYDNDGDLDVVITGTTNGGSSGAVAEIWDNDGSGNFTKNTSVSSSLTGAYRSGAAFGDYDNDGFLDLVIIGYNTSGTPTTTLYNNDEDGTFSTVSGTGFTDGSWASASWGDANNDGYLDLYLGGLPSSGTRFNTIYLNDKDGTFTDATAGILGSAGGDFVHADYDNDGDLDVAIAGYTNSGYAQSKFFRNDNGTYNEVSAISSLLLANDNATMEWGDFDNDGDLDLFNSGGGSAKILINDGSGGLSNSGLSFSGVWDGYADWSDYDLDGDVDLLYIGNNSGSKSFLYDNDGDGTFTLNTDFSLTIAEQGTVDWVDVDNDGDADLFITGYLSTGSRTASLYKNNEVTTNTAPSTPVLNNITFNGSETILSWNPSNDTEGGTPSYNAFLYSLTTSQMIVEPQSDTTSGFRKVLDMGNMRFDTSRTLSLAEGRYSLGIQAIDAAGKTSVFAKSTFEVVFPDPVDSLRGERVNDTFTLTWDPTVGATSYKIYFTTDTTSQSTFTASTTDTSYSGTIYPGSTIFYSVKVVDSNNVESVASNYVEIENPFNFQLHSTHSNQILDIASGPSAVRHKSDIDWVDYDNDGDLDVSIIGEGGGYTGIMAIFEYDAITGFTQDKDFVNTDIILDFGEADWGDYDNDGDLDFVVAGYDDVESANVATVYRNKGSGVFNEVTDIKIALSAQSLPRASIRWVDIDNDGDLDIFHNGVTGISRSFLYRNNGNDSFVDANFTFNTLFNSSTLHLAVDEGEIELIDINNDGYIDVSGTGRISIGFPFTGISINSKDNQFTDSGNSLTYFADSSLEWGDLDEDGDPDLVLMGYDSGNSALKTEIYLNDGSGNLSLHSTLDGYRRGDIALGDIDNDGDLDLVISGLTNNTDYSTAGNKVFSNDLSRSNTFIELTGSTLAGLGRGNLVFADYDKDGDLDLIMNGQDASGYKSYIYENTVVTAGTAPGKPSNLSLVVKQEEISITWNAATDANGGPLHYEAFVLKPDKTPVFYAKSDISNGFRQVSALGNAGYNNLITLDVANLERGNYTIGVQAIDATGLAGEFAIEQIPIRAYFTPFGISALKDTVTTIPLSTFQRHSFLNDSTLTLSLRSAPNAQLFIDADNDYVMDAGEVKLDSTGFNLSLLATDSLRISSNTTGFEDIILKITTPSGSVVDSATIQLAMFESSPSISGTADTGGWYLMANPLQTTLGSLFGTIWTQGAINADSESGTPNLYFFNPDSAKYIAITTDLDTTKAKAGQGILAYIFPDDNYNDAIDPVEGGWPKSLINYGEPFKVNEPVVIKNTDVDGNGFTSGSEGFVLMGNPYGLPVSVDSLIAELVKIDPYANRYVYLWDPIEKQYNLNLTGFVNAYESFFVRTIQSGISGSMVFEYDDVHESARLKRTETTNPIELNLFAGDLSTGEYAIRLGEEADVAIDPLDGYYLGSFASNFANLYSTIGDQPLVLNNLPIGLTEELEIPLFLHSTESGEHTLEWSVNDLPKDWRVELENPATGEIIKLSEQSSYTFEFTSGQFKAKSTREPTPELFAFHAAKMKTKASQSDLILRINPGVATSGENDLDIPKEVELYQNYPNPFNPTSVIRFGVPEQSNVKLEVFDILGRRVATLLNNEIKPAGRYNISFVGNNLASGMYLYRLSVGNKVIVKKMTLIK